MITLTWGNLPEDKVEAIVNTVNCVGVMGKGIALQFKQGFPDNFKAYARACKNSDVRLGKMFIFSTDSFVNLKYIINFPTKNHRRGKSKIEDVETGLADLAKELCRLKIKSIAIPPLGCGYGGLSWADVRRMVENTFKNLPEIEVHLYEPKGAPEAESMPIDTKTPNMTKSRALFIKLLQQYTIPGYRLSLLEIQKLAYFLQISGEPLRLKYEKHTYDPYAENLNFVLQHIEGHFIRGYGDRSRKASIQLLPGAEEQADNFLKNSPEATKHLSRVANLIEGFETPYGMELLSSVHWVCMDKKNPAQNTDKTCEKIFTWNARKKKTFEKSHIIKARNRLSEQNWLGIS
ncbi:MAG: macro domain-containing protein [Dissulfuribacterales bacterium]